MISKNKLALLFLSFYILHLLGLFYTENTHSGLFDIQVKLSLFIFPIVFASRPFSAANKRIVFYAFIAGALASSLVMIIRATYFYITAGENYFFYQSFSFLLHPSYLSMYLNLASAWIIINLIQNKFTAKKYLNFCAVFIVLFFSFIIVLLSSKMGLITMVLSYTSFLIYYIISRKKYILGVSGLLTIALSIYSVIYFVPEISGRINRAISAVTNTTANQADTESTAVRILVWKAANQVVSENLIVGTGTGDPKDALMVEYNKRGMTGAFEHKLNAHSEFYQVFVSLGLIGFLILLIHLLLPLGYAFKWHNYIYSVFLLIIILNFFTESMLETEAGVIFFAFFNSLLCFTAFENKSQISNPQSL
ncbi:MAG: O-antigen ligase family protein [Bacteroidota bacterium]